MVYLWPPGCGEDQQMFLRRVNKQARLPGPRQPLSQSSSSSPKPHLVSGLPGTGRVSPAASKELTPPPQPPQMPLGGLEQSLPFKTRGWFTGKRNLRFLVNTRCVWLERQQISIYIILHSSFPKHPFKAVAHPHRPTTRPGGLADIPPRPVSDLFQKVPFQSVAVFFSHEGVVMAVAGKKGVAS